MQHLVQRHGGTEACTSAAAAAAVPQAEAPSVSEPEAVLPPEQRGSAREEHDIEHQVHSQPAWDGGQTEESAEAGTVPSESPPPAAGVF